MQKKNIAIITIKDNNKKNLASVTAKSESELLPPNENPNSNNVISAAI